MNDTPAYGYQHAPPDAAGPSGQPGWQPAAQPAAQPLPWQHGGPPPQHAPWPAPISPAPQPATAPHPQAPSPRFQPSTPPHPQAPPQRPVSGPHVGAPAGPPRRRRWVPVVAAVVVVLLVVAGAAVAWRALGDDDGVAAPTANATPSRSRSATPTDPNGDEFDGSSLEEPRWGVYGSTSPNGSVWSRDAVTVKDGILRITATGRNPTGGGNVAGGLCWCGPGGNRTSGVWSVRARFDAGAGYGPGLMLWPESDRAADGFATFAGLPAADRATVRSLVMWGAAGGKAESTLAGDFTQWHVYRVEWRPGSLKMFVDERVLFDSATRPGVVVPTRPMHLVIQVVAGPKDGIPAANAATPDTVVTEVDWVRYSP